MTDISEYQKLAVIYESEGSIIYRAIRAREKLPVIIKVLRNEYPEPREIRRFRREYEISSRLRMRGVIRALEMTTWNNRTAIIFQDCGGRSLKSWLSEESPELRMVLKIGVCGIDILAEVHRAGIIHQDINPANIILVSEAPEVELIDFGISLDLTHEKYMDDMDKRLEGTLAYISPEQTGRLKRSVDYRTDYYSFGVALYELLTRRLPFEAGDSMEMVHCHIARTPPSPRDHNAAIPEAVSLIVMKLMAKNPENRYQSAEGIRSDLVQCLDALEKGQTRIMFEPGQRDVSGRLQLSRRLYAREAELDKLNEALTQIKTGRLSMVFISGYSGVGKSALVMAFRKHLATVEADRRHSIIHRFIYGKYEPLQRDTPYSALIQALTDLIRQVLSENQARLEHWRKRIMEAIQPNGRLIVDILPELERIIGRQPDIPDLSPAESQNRFNLTLQNFINSLANAENPLILFLDDLHLADSATFWLLRRLAEDHERRHLLFIGAFRDNEVNATHPLMGAIEYLEKNGVVIEQLKPAPLNVSQTNQFVADTLACDLQTAKSLSAIIHQKTNGNPFFTGVFLRTLQAEQLLRFDVKLGIWEWAVERVMDREITDNAARLMSSRIEQLAAETRDILCHAACIGNEFEIVTLGELLETPLARIMPALELALSEGFLIKSGRSAAADRSSPDSDAQNSEFQGMVFKFSHDQVHDAAYSLLDQAEKEGAHLKIGRLLKPQLGKPHCKTNIFAVVSHLNLGVRRIVSPDEIDELAEMNWAAGKKARHSAAYQSSLKYLAMGVALLGEDLWERRYQLALALHSETAEAAYLSGDFGLMAQMTAQVLRQARTLLDKAKAWEVQTRSLMAQNRLIEALRLAQNALCQLGLTLPEKPHKGHVLLELIKTRLAFLGKGPNYPITLKKMTDPHKLAITRLLSVIGHAAYIVDQNLMPIIALRVVRLSLKYGNTSFSIYSYAGYGIILCAFLNEVNLGYKLGNTALMLLGQPENKEIECRTINLYNTFIRHFREHARETLFPLAEAYQKGLDVGDLEYAGISAFCFAGYSFWVGRDLTVIEAEIREYMPAVKRLGQEVPRHWYEMVWQAALNLLDKAENPLRLSGEAYNELEMLPLHMNANDRVGLCYLHFIKLFICYLFGDYREALQNSVIAEKYLEAQLGTMTVPIFYCFDSLTRIACYRSASRKEQKQIMAKVAANQRKLKRYSDNAPMNHLHKWHLVTAMVADVCGDDLKAMSHFKHALRFAKQHRYGQDEALINELTAWFYYDRKEVKIARLYLKDAHYAYLRWGAVAKARQLEQESRQKLDFSPSERMDYATPHTATVSYTTIKSESKLLDLTTVLKSSQAISGEIELSRLLEKVMRVVIENAGAQIGFLILQRDGRYYIEAEAGSESEQVITLQSLPLEPSAKSTDSPRLSAAVLNYVIHARENVVLTDAANEGLFINDPYIAERQTKSLLCIPLIHRAKFSGVLYLENNLTTGAFTPERLELLTLLSSQMAVSIENASLYENLKTAAAKLEDYSKTLEQKVDERTRELHRKNIKLNEALAEVEGYNRKITQSIQYAKRIQESLLPNQEEIKTRLPRSFIIWMPRDIVGGDMFFAQTFDQVLLLAILDCTGHGVPGALMTMIASSGLKQIVQTEKHQDPAEILQRLNYIVKTSLQQDTAHAVSDDGLDAGICRIDPANRTIAYAGARLSLMQLRGQDLQVIPGDKHSIGYKRSDLNHAFVNRHSDIQPGDGFYLFTDGFTDQLGGEKGRCFGKKRLRELILDLAGLSFDAQQQRLLDEFNRYKGDHERQDDVTALGFGF